MWKRNPRHLEPKKKNPKDYGKFFLGIPADTVKRTFEATTQLGRMQGNTKHWLRRQIKAPNPALNVPRRNEPVATDTVYGPLGHPAVDDGSTHAQFFIGRISGYRTIRTCGRSDKDAWKCIADEIRKHGAMTVLVSDRARAQIGAKVIDLLRTYMTDSRQSEPHNKNQNFAELGWRDTKVLSNRVLERSGAPKKCWFLALRHVCMLMNHVAREGLGWRTAAEWLLGYTPDITVFLIFMFYEPVYYMDLEPSMADWGDLLGSLILWGTR